MINVILLQKANSSVRITRQSIQAQALNPSYKEESKIVAGCLYSDHSILFRSTYSITQHG